MPDHTYSVLMDGRVIVTHTDTEGVHPVYAITLMGNKLSRYMTDANKETINGALEEARKEMGLGADQPDALALLREQWPVEPNKPGTAYKTTWSCGVCSYPISTDWVACPSCGKAVKWDESN